MAIYLGSLELATGGGATGTGLPVNTYESFYVSATGNPTGYNATTGLYTHPNGDYWLKTGNTITDSNGDYPNATASGGSVLTTNASTIAPFNPPNWTKNYFTWAADGVYGFITPSVGGLWPQLVQYSTTYPFTYVTNSDLTQHGTKVAGADYAGIAMSPNLTQKYWKWSDASSTTFYSFGSGADITGIPNMYFAKGIAVDNSGLVYVVDWIQDQSVRVINQAGTVISSQPIPGNGQSESLTVGNDGYLYLMDTARYLYRAPLSNIAGGFGPVVDLSAATAGYSSAAVNQSNPSEIFLFNGNPTSSTNTTNIDVFTYSSPVVGDSTARTDTDSSQPLFIKIK